MTRISMAIAFVGSFLFVLSANAQGQLPVIDFKRYFPHFFAVSQEIREHGTSSPVQWKFLTVRDEKDRHVWVELVRRESRGETVQEFLAKGPLEGSEGTLRRVVAKFAEAENIHFEIVDLRNIESAEAFAERARSLGWGLRAIDK